MEPPRPKYKKMAGFATTHGQQYEERLAALLFLRGLNSGTAFQIGTNVAGAGALDDVVFRFKPPGADEWTTTFVQLKHKARRPVSRRLLTNPSGDFSLPHYFQSYLAIEQAMAATDRDTLFSGSFQRCTFVIFTNASGGHSLGKERFEAVGKEEEFLWTCSGNVFSFDDDQEVLDSLGEGGDKGKAFLRRLRVFCGQPNAALLKAAVEAELRKVNTEIVRGADLPSLLDCFLKHVKNWCERSNDVLDADSDLLRVAVLEVTSQQIRRDSSLDVGFKEGALEPLKEAVASGCRVLLVAASERSCRLTFAKLLQAATGRPLALNSASLLTNQKALLSQWRKGDFRSLIIFTDDWRAEFSTDVIKVVKDVRAIPDTPSVIFLANENSAAGEALKNAFQETAMCFKDDFLFAQLNAQTREKVLAREVTLQGQRITLWSTFKGADRDLDKHLDAPSVVEVLGSEGDLPLGSAPGDGIGYYVDRSLEVATAVKASVFQDGALRETVTVRVTLGDSSTSPKRAAKESFGRRACAISGQDAFIGRTVGFLSALFESSRPVKDEALVSSLADSPLFLGEGDAQIGVGPTLPVGEFEVNAVRLAGSDTVTALRVRTSKHATRNTCFLFLSEETNENDARKLSALHQSKHLLSIADGRLRWVQSHGDVGFLRPHIDDTEKEATTLRLRSPMDVEDRLVLLCAEPGMGKSTLMARLAGSRHIRDEYRGLFVITVALNDHSQLFAKGKHKDALGFLCSAGKIESPLHRSLLKYALEVSGEVVVLFDGYDEIAPRYGKQCCDLVASILEKTRARKVWMTSRNTFKNHLETTFSTFAFRLRKFDKADQKSFLKKFWLEKSTQVCKRDEVDGFIDQLLEKTSRAVRDNERNLMGIPLQTQMLAEVYEDHVRTGLAEQAKLPDTLELLMLLDQFVDKKCSIYVKDKFRIEESKVANYDELYDILKSVFVYRHMKAALGLLLEEDIIKTQMESILKETWRFFKKIERGKDKTGFIEIVDGKPRFIHRVFAEYFVAKWISEHVAGNAGLIKSKMFTDDFAVIRNLFDRSLAKDCVLHAAVINEDLEEVRTLLAREDIDVDAKDGGGRTALHLAASLGTSEDRGENERRGAILDLLIGKTSDFGQVDDVLKSTPLKYGDVTRSWIAIDRFLGLTNNKELLVETSADVANQGMLDTVIDFDLHRLLGFCLDNGLPVEHCPAGKRRLLLRACEKGSLKVASLLVERNANINIDSIQGEASNKDKPGMKKEVHHRTALHVASQHGRVEIAKLLLGKYISALEAAGCQAGGATATEPPSASEYVNVKDEDGNTAIHEAARHGHADVISVLVCHGGDMRSLTRNNATPLHLAAQFKHPGAVKVLLETLDEADRASTVRQCDTDGDSVLSCAAWGGCVECVKLLIAAGGTILQDGDPGRGLTINRTTPLHRAAHRRHPEALRVLLESLDEVDRSVAVRQCDNDGDSLLSCAAWGGCVECVRLVIKAGGTLSPPSGDQENTLNERESDGGQDVIDSLRNTGADADVAVHRTTPFHRAAAKKHLDVLRLLLAPLDEAARAAAVNARDDDGDDVLYNAAYGGCVECVKLVAQCGGRLVPAADTPLMTAALRGNQAAADYLLAIFDPLSEGISKPDYVNLKNGNGKTAIFLASQNGHTDLVRLLIDQGGDPRWRNPHNSLALHLAAEYQHPGVVEVLLEALDEAERAEAVNSCDLDGDSVLMCAALGGSVECVELLIRAGGTLSTFERDGETLLIAMASKGSQAILSFLLRSYNADAEEMTEGRSDLSGFLQGLADKRRSRDSDAGSTLLHRLAANGHPGELRTLLEALGEAGRVEAVNARDEAGDTVLARAAYGGCVECVELAVGAGAKFCPVNDDGRTALMQASVKKRADAVRCLLTAFGREREGVGLLEYIGMADKDGKTASDLADYMCRVVIENSRVLLVQEQ